MYIEKIFYKKQKVAFKINNVRYRNATRNYIR